MTELPTYLAEGYGAILCATKSFCASWEDCDLAVLKRVAVDEFAEFCGQLQQLRVLLVPLCAIGMCEPDVQC